MPSIELEPGAQVVLTDTATNKGDLGKAIVEAGFIVGPGVSKKTSLLVAGDPNGETSKARKARDYGIPIIGEYDFIAKFLGGEVAPDVDIASHPVPTCPEELVYSEKRSPADMKKTVSGLRDGLRLVVHMADGTVYAGSCCYSPLAEGWMVAGVQIASKTTADKAVVAIHLAQGESVWGTLDLIDVEPGMVVSAEFTSHPYGTFTVYGRVERGITRLQVGKWLLLPDAALNAIRSLDEPAKDHECEEDWFGHCYTCSASLLGPEQAVADAP